MEKGGLGLGSNESKSLGLRVDILEGGGIDCDRLVEQTLELGRKDGIDVALFDRKIVCVFPIDLRLVGVDLGHVLFLGLTLFLIRRVRAGLVILEVADEFRADADRACDDVHDVLGEGSRLAGADDRGIGHGLTGTEDSNEEIVGSHSLGSESEGEGYGERETFRNSDDDQCDRDD